MSISAVGPTVRAGVRRAAPDVFSAGGTEYDRRVGLLHEWHRVGVLVAVTHPTGTPWSYECTRRGRRRSPGLLDARGLGLVRQPQSVMSPVCRDHEDGDRVINFAMC
jgi:YD repeat-containing protein